MVNFDELSNRVIGSKNRYKKKDLYCKKKLRALRVLRGEYF